MAEPILIFRDCGNCAGSGQILHTHIDENGNLVLSGGSFDCPACGGDGKGAIGFLDSSVAESFEDVINRCNDILNKCNDILEELSS